MAGMAVREWMSKNVATAVEDDSVFDVVKIMVEKTIGSVVIVDEEKKAIGMLTVRDVLNRIVALGYDAKLLKVRDVMTKDVITVNVSDDYIIADRLIKYINIRHLPVVDDDGKLTGILSVRDLIKIV